MNYVIAAWLSCGAILLAYALRMVHRERSLRRSLSPKIPGAARRAAEPGVALSASGHGEPDRPFAPRGGR
jgi:hypothetical protein